MFGSKSTVALVLVGMLALAGCRAETLQNISDAPYGVSASSSPSPLTLNDYEKAIIRAGSRRNWIFERVEDGHMVATNDVRGKHKAVVDIMFNTETVSITYKSSTNLNRDVDNNAIHPNYNHWVRNLLKDIRSEVQLAKAT